MARVVGVTAILWCVASAAAAAPPPPPKAPTASDCQHLLHQFDVAWNARRGGTHAQLAHKNRDTGEAECREGHYADGILHVRRALHDLGLKPVKRPAHAAPR
jgi:hypothetical protein